MTNVSPYKLGIIVFVDLQDRSGRKQARKKTVSSNEIKFDRTDIVV